MTLMDMVIQLLFGTNSDPIITIIIYIGAIMFSVVLMAGVFRLFHHIGNMISGK